MINTPILDALDLLVISVMLIPAFVIILIYNRNLIMETLVSIIRMVIQLLLVGLYLGFIFSQDSPIFVFLWIIVMVFVASFSITNGAKLPKKIFFFPLVLAVGAATIAVSFYLIIVGVAPSPWYSGQFVIPLFGMILGNSMRGIIISSRSFFEGLQNGKKELIFYYRNGADKEKAVAPFFKRAMEASISPNLSTMATIGLVSLPGMMTGQILGGNIPMTAISYQIAIMISIFSSIVLSNFLALHFLGFLLINERGLPKKIKFAKKA